VFYILVVLLMHMADEGQYRCDGLLLEEQDL